MFDFTAARSTGIRVLFDAMMPWDMSKKRPLEKSNGSPAASHTTPPASASMRQDGEKGERASLQYDTILDVY